MTRTIDSQATLYVHGGTLRFRYTNHKLETEQRTARVLSVWYGASEYHQGPQWFLMAHDLDRGQIRNFAMRDMTEVSHAAAAEPPAGAAPKT
jgi:predicted DNA-binding transcriptional regulator YafY